MPEDWLIHPPLNDVRPQRRPRLGHEPPLPEAPTRERLSLDPAATAAGS